MVDAGSPTCIQTLASLQDATGLRISLETSQQRFEALVLHFPLAGRAVDFKQSRLQQTISRFPIHTPKVCLKRKPKKFLQAVWQRVRDASPASAAIRRCRGTPGSGWVVKSRPAMPSMKAVQRMNQVDGVINSRHTPAVKLRQTVGMAGANKSMSRTYKRAPASKHARRLALCTCSLTRESWT